MRKKSKIPTILGIILLFAGVFAGVVLLRNTQIFKIGATPSVTPKDVRVTNISDSSATISWATDDATTGFVSWGTSQSTGTFASESESEQKFPTHSITLTGLGAETKYYFKINSEGSNFDNNGVPWEFSTGKQLPLNDTTQTISGSVISASGSPINRGLVYITINGYVLSTLSSQNGTYVMQLGSVRNPDLSSYAQISPSKTLLEISVMTDSGDVATAKIFPQSANPVPPLIVGQDQDFRTLAPSSDGLNPEADLNLPEGSTPSSKFDVTGKAEDLTTSVTLDSVDEGEVINSDKPQFFGDGPKGSEITITIHSDTELTGSTIVAPDGSWKWSPPDNLSEGVHSIVISWVDASGITRTLTRNFVVQAGELPAYVSTPSASPTITPTPSASPKTTSTPTPSPSLTPIPSVTPTVSATPTSTPVSLPESGSLTPTIALSIIGMVVMFFSYGLWKISEN